VANNGGKDKIFKLNQPILCYFFHKTYRLKKRTAPPFFPRVQQTLKTGDILELPTPTKTVHIPTQKAKIAKTIWACLL